MPLSRHGVGTYLETSPHATCQGTLGHSLISQHIYSIIKFNPLVVVAFSSLVRILGEFSIIHSLPALFLSF